MSAHQGTHEWTFFLISDQAGFIIFVAPAHAPVLSTDDSHLERVPPDQWMMLVALANVSGESSGSEVLESFEDGTSSTSSVSPSLSDRTDRWGTRVIARELQSIQQTCRRPARTRLVSSEELAHGTRRSRITLKVLPRALRIFLFFFRVPLLLERSPFVSCILQHL